jgi:DNA-binding transcriptional MerR regulator
MPVFGKKEETKRGYVPTEEVLEMMQKKIPEGEIIESLRRGGFSPDEIAQAFVEASKKIFAKPEVKEEKKEEVQPVKVEEKKEEVEEKKEEEKKEEKPETPPVFIKVEKYDEIVLELGKVKDSLEEIKTIFVSLNELEKTLKESLNAVQGIVQELEERISKLYSTFLKPYSYVETPAEGVEDVERILSELKDRIEELKSEMVE